MRSKRPQRTAKPDPDARRVSQRATAGLLDQRPLDGLGHEPLPQVHLRSATFHPFLYRKMIDRVDAAARPGDLVAVVDKHGELFGNGLFNPRSEIVVRMLTHGSARVDEAFWQERLERAVALRRDMLRLDTVTNAYRVVHAEADALSGLVIDRFGDVLSAEAFSLGIFQRAGAILNRLHAICGTRHHMVSVPDHIHGQEGFLADPIRSPELAARVAINEFGTRFRVHLDEGHKTGFFCDQRENRRTLAGYCAGRTVLDLCCYSGGFAIQAKRLGEATEVTGVDLDERAIAVARENANLNQLRIQFVHADVFAYMRDMLATGRNYDVVVLDPPKLIRSRREIDEGTKKHFDLNRLAMQLVAPGGLLLSCSCSGLLGRDEFLRVLSSAARASGPLMPSSDPNAPRRHAERKMQILAQSGAAPDHPVALSCPETEYLQAVWMRLE